MLLKFERNPLSCFDTRPDIMQVKKWIGVSASHLKALFIEHHNMSISQFTRIEWVKKVAGLLKSEAPKSFKSIAFDCEWGSAGSLSADFKKVLGMSPSVYRLSGR